MNNTNDFEIENGVLLKYTGSDSVVVIPDGITEIGDRAFNGCKYLEKIIIPDCVTSIGKFAFSSCHKLKEFTIPNGVTSINRCLFYECTSLEQVTIPQSVKSISDKVFWLCISLKQITIPPSVTSIDTCAFSGCSSLKEITIPDSVTTIGTNTFSGCDQLKEFTIPGSVMSIGGQILWFCDALEKITFKGCSITEILESEFEYRHPPFLYAPNLRLNDIHSAKFKFNLCLSFIKNLDKTGEMSDEVKRDYINYLKTNKESAIKISEYALQDESAMLYLSNNRLIPYDELDSLIEKSQENKNPSVTTILIEYKNKFNSRDKDEFDLGTL